MGDLISRSALLADIITLPHSEFIMYSDDVKQIIADAPAVDAEPVRHAYWEVKQEDSLQCSACHERWAIRDRGEFIEFEVQEDLKWCPSCGARMDAEVT